MPDWFSADPNFNVSLLKLWNSEDRWVAVVMAPDPASPVVINGRTMVMNSLETPAGFLLFGELPRDVAPERGAPWTMEVGGERRQPTLRRQEG